MTATSPYLNAAARRASISIHPTRPIIGIVANEQMRFARTRTDGLPLEKTGSAIEPAWHGWVAGALTFLAIGIYAVFF